MIHVDISFKSVHHSFINGDGVQVFRKRRSRISLFPEKGCKQDQGIWRLCSTWAEIRVFHRR